MVHDHDVRLCRAPSRLEKEAAVEVGALEPGAQIRLRRHRVPHLAARLVGEIGERAVARPGGPRREAVELRPALVLEQRVPLLPGLVEARQADVVPPPFEQRERRRMVARAERAREDREILARALGTRSEEHTSELQSRRDLVCRLLLEKKKIITCTVTKNIRKSLT